MMKIIKLFLGLIIFTTFISSCKKCNNEDPTARVVNNGTSEVSLQITEANGNVISISDLGKGLISSEKSYAPGITTIAGTIASDQLHETVEMVECTSYDITITSENKIVIFSTKKK